MDVKALPQGAVKVDKVKGTFTAVVSTHNVIDSDGDITEPGALPDGKTVAVSAYGHSSWGDRPPIGVATLKVSEARTIAEGRFFLGDPGEPGSGSQTARDTFTAVKELADVGLGEWSYGYDVLEADMAERDDGGSGGARRVRILKQVDVHEVSPVLIGAGVGTRTLTAKARKEGDTMTGNGTGVKATRGAIKSHTAPTTARAWEPGDMEATLTDVGVDGLRSVYAWVDTTGDPTDRKSYRLPHHHGVDGMANVRALVYGIAGLNGAYPTGIPEGDRKAVYDHLAHHLGEHGVTPPELREAGGTLTLYEEGVKALVGVDAYLTSADRVAALRAEKGKPLSQLNLDTLDWVGEELRRLVSRHKAVTRAAHDAPADALGEEFVKFLQLTHMNREEPTP